MRVSRRIDEIITLLEKFALGELAVPKSRVAAALRLLDLYVADSPPDGDGGNEAPAAVDDRAVAAFAQKFAA
jgi:hypothetical protein